MYPNIYLIVLLSHIKLTSNLKSKIVGFMHGSYGQHTTCVYRSS